MTEENLQRDIDRYVDGELGPDDLTELLRRCESEPEGWKLCAMALIEAREVGSVLRDLVSEPGPAQAPAADGSWKRNLLAATCALALLMLAYVGGRLSARADPGESRLTKGDRSAASVEEADAVAQQTSDSMQNHAAANGAEPTDVEPETVPDEPSVFVVGYARLHQSRGAGPPVPVISGPDLDFAELVRRPPVLPEHVYRQAGNNGLHLQPVRQVMALELSDGRRLAVPLDSVGVRYVGHSVL